MSVKQKQQIQTQLLISDIPTLPHADNFVSPRNDEHKAIRKKPAQNSGLWTSSFREETQDSAWVEWCRWEDFDAPYEKHWYLLQPARAANLYVIDGVDNLRTMLKRYPLETSLSRQFRELYAFLDFEAIARDYDGIWLTERGNAATHLSYPHNLGWDVESVLWCKWAFESVREIDVPPVPANEVYS